MMNGETIREKVESDKNILAGLLERDLSEADMISALYERAYSRLPSDSELKAIQEDFHLERRSGLDSRQLLESFLWAILNSKEFQLNH
jgi:hypothetical protein